jgi:cob(I)alamin adenosyltransferase
MVIVVILAAIKIYLSNQIYYNSRRVNYIEREVAALREEHAMLENQVQKQKFKNRVSDTIFLIDDRIYVDDKGEEF